MSYFDDYEADMLLAEDEAFDAYELERSRAGNWIDLLKPYAPIRIIDFDRKVLWTGLAGDLKDKTILNAEIASIVMKEVESFTPGFEIKVFLWEERR